jgi:hypothetical protein
LDLLKSGGSKKLPLQLATDLMRGARADNVAIGERMRDRVQKWIAQVDRQRPGGGKCLIVRARAKRPLSPSPHH